MSDEQSKAIGALSGFGATVVTEASNLARYMGKVLGTAPHDLVGVVLGDPLHFVRTTVAAKYDEMLDEIFKRRGFQNVQPVSPSVAIPLLRAAYDEGRPELQELWAGLIATAMDSSRSGRFRLSFIDTLKRFDPLDALVLEIRLQNTGDMLPSPVAGIANMLKLQQADVQLSVDNLTVLYCVAKIDSQVNFYVTTYGRALYEACTT